MDLRRRMLLSDSGKSGIFITAADETNWVKVGDVTYTVPTSVPITEETTFEMAVGYSMLSSKTFTWSVDGTDFSFKTSSSYQNAKFTARMGHLYKIDAVNKVIEVDIPKDWDGLIFGGNYSGIYAPYLSGKATITDKAGLNFSYSDGGCCFGPIDVKNFNSLFVSAGTRTDTYDGCYIYLYDSAPGELKSTPSGYFASNRVAFNDDRYSSSYTFDLTDKAEIWVLGKNLFSSKDGYIETIRLNK